jgi:hypothetical protein
MSELVKHSAPSTGLELIALFEKVGVIQHEGGVGLELPPNLSYDEYEAIGRWLWLTRESIQFMIGDWLNYGEHTYESDIYTQAAYMTGASDSTLKNWKHISKALPPQRRQPLHRVRHSIQAEVAHNDLPAAEQRRILKQAADEGLSRLQVRDLVREARGEPEPKVEPPDVCAGCGRPL